MQEFLDPQLLGLSAPFHSVERGRSEHIHRRLFEERRSSSLEDGSDCDPRMKLRHHPYNREPRRRTRMPAVKLEPDASKLRQRCSRDGGDPEAIELIPRIFSGGVTLSALTRQRTAEEVASGTFGQGPGQVYLILLGTVPTEQSGSGTIGFRYRCRLCPDSAKVTTWKHERDVLRHLRKYHFGLANKCERWCVSPFIGSLYVDV
jgi:hypothetical protein